MEPLLTSMYAFIILAGFVGAIGDAFLNQWAKQGRISWLLLGYIVWIVTATIVAYMLKKEIFGTAIVMFLLSNVVFALVISRFYFFEHLSIAQWIGIALSVLAVVLMNQDK
jgi:multidrug transporter EmrE-like cation transporter